MRPLSLKARITLLTVTIVAIVIAVVSAVAYHELREGLVRVPDSALRAVVAAVRSGVADAAAQPTDEGLKAILRRTPSADAVDLIMWSEAEGNVRIVYASVAGDARAWIADLNQAKRPNSEKERLLTLRHGGGLYRAAWFRHGSAGNTLSGLAVTTLNYVQQEMQEFLPMLLVLGVSMLLAASILAALSVLWAMRPIRLTAARLDGVTYRNLGPEHLEGISTPVELAPFVGSVRAMLARVAEGVESQKRFIAEASHELRTPLALAKSTIQAARFKARTSEQYQQTLDELLADVDRLSRMVGQLLDLTRLEETAPSASEDVPVGTMLCSLAEQYETDAAAAGSRIVCDLPEVAPIVKGSPIELEGLFGNLIDNAVKHGPKGGRIDLRVVSDGSACLVSVHDEGGRVPADQVGRVFDRFYRPDASRSRATGGSGLGLAIAKRVALRHGGDIRMASSPAEGTTVSVRLPLANHA